MGRRKGSKNRNNGDNTTESPVQEELKPEMPDQEILEKESPAEENQEPETEKPLERELPAENQQEQEYISTFKAAERLNTSEATIELWIDHGHLEGENGKVSVRSIKNCRFNTRRPV